MTDPHGQGQDHGSDDSRLDEAYADYFEMRDSDSLDMDVLLERYPDFHDELLELLETDESIRQWDPGKTVLGQDKRPHGDTGEYYRRPPEEASPTQIGKFRIIRALGSGGMGTVYLARQTGTEIYVALKKLPSLAALNPEAVKRFHNEVTAASRLDHDHIVPVYYREEDGSENYFIMKFIDGPDLSELIRRISAERSQANESGSQPEAARASPSETTSPDMLVAHGSTRRKHTEYFRSVANTIATVADALQHAHEMGIVHRDIKPGNLLLDKHGKVWVTDFGLAQIVTNPDVTEEGVLLGTYRYMSPEQAYANLIVVDHRTDIYSLGVTLYELLTLKYAFHGRTRSELLNQVAFADPKKPRSVQPDVPEELEVITLKAMSKAPDDRYQTAAEFGRDLRRYLNNEPIIARRPTLRKRLFKWAQRHKQFVATSVLVGLILCIAGIAVTLNEFHWIRSVADMQTRQRQVLQQKNTELAGQIDVANGLRLATESSLVLDDDPAAATALAREAVRLADNPRTRAALINAFDRNHQKMCIRHTGRVRNLSLNPTSTRIVAALVHGHDSTERREEAVVWDLETGAVVVRFPGVTFAEFSRGGRLVTTSKTAGRTVVSIRNVGTFVPAFSLRAKRSFTAHESIVSASGGRIVTIGEDAVAHVHDMIEGTHLVSFDKHSSPTTLAAFVGDGQHVMTAHQDNSIWFWDAVSADSVGSVRSREPVKFNLASGRSLPVSADGRSLATSTANAHIQVWDTRTGELRSTRQIRGKTAVFADSDLMLCDKFGKTDIRSVATEARVALLDGRLMAVSSGGQYVAVARKRGPDSHHEEVRIYNPASGVHQSTLKGHSDLIEIAKFSEDSRSLITVAKDNTLRFWSVDSGKDRRTLVKSEIGPHSSIRVESPGRVLFPTEGTIRSTTFDVRNRISDPAVTGHVVIDPLSDERSVLVQGRELLIHQPDGDQPNPRRVYFTSEIRNTKSRGCHCIVTTYDGAATYCDTSTFESTIIDGFTAGVSDTDFSADAATIAISCWDGLVRVFDTRLRRCVKDLPHNHGISSVRISPADDVIATSSADGRIALWQLDAGNRLNESLEAPGCDSLLFSPDGRYLVAYSSAPDTPGRIHVFATDSGEVASYSARRPLTSVAHLPGVNSVVIAGIDGTLIWSYLTDTESVITSTPTLRLCVLGTSGLLCTAHGTSPTGLSPFKGPHVRPALRLWSLDGAQVANLPAVRGFVTSIRGNAEQLTVTARYHDLRIIDANTGQSAITKGAHSAPITFFQSTPDITKIVTAGLDGTCLVSDARTGRAIRQLETRESPVTCGVVTANGIALGHADGTTVVYHPSTLAPASSLPHRDAVAYIREAHGDRTQLLSIDRSGSGWLYSTMTQSAVPVSLGESVQALSYSKSGRLAVLFGGLITGDRSREKFEPTPRTSGVWLFENATDSRPRQLRPPDRQFQTCWSPQGNLLLTAGVHSLHVWDPAQAEKPMVSRDFHMIRTARWMGDQHVIVQDSRGITLVNASNGDTVCSHIGTFDGDPPLPGRVHKVKLGSLNSSEALVVEAGCLRRAPFTVKAMLAIFE